MSSNEIEYPHEVEGAKELAEWFGEVVSIELNRTAASSIKVHAFEMTSTVNATGHYACTKHVVVNFIFDGITALSLEDFNHQNVISTLVLLQSDDGYEVVMGGCYGVEARIKAAKLSILLEPGIPPGSIYE